MNLIRSILEKWACRHKWKTMADVECFDKTDGVYHKLPTFTRRTLVCQGCGKIKRIEL